MEVSPEGTHPSKSWTFNSIYLKFNKENTSCFSQCTQPTILAVLIKEFGIIFSSNVEAERHLYMQQMEDLRSCKPHLVSPLGVSFQKNLRGFAIFVHSKPGEKMIWFLLLWSFMWEIKKWLLKYCYIADFLRGLLISTIFSFYFSCLILLNIDYKLSRVT